MEDQALNHLSILLSQVVHQSSTPGSLRERLFLMAEDFARRYIGKLNVGALSNTMLHLQNLPSKSIQQFNFRY